MSREVPDGWEVRRIADVASVKGGKRMPAGRPFADGKTDHPYIRVSDFSNGSIDRAGIVYVLPEDQKLISRYTISSRDVYISIAGTIGVCGMIPPDLGGAQLTENAAKITVHSEAQLMPEFLALLVSSELVQRQISTAKGVGGGVPKLALFRIEGMTVPVPPLNEQRRIAEILSSVDEAIVATRVVIEQTESVKHSAVLDLVQGKHVPGERKPTTGWRIGNFGVATIPATWKIVRLTSIAKLESGHTPSKKVPEYWGGTINWLSLHDTKSLGKRKIFETAQKTNQLGIDNSSARLLPAGTVCLSRTASIGHCVILGTEMATSQDFANYVCGVDISNEFLMFLFRGMGDVWKQLSSGSTHKTIYMPIFEQLQIILPPLSVQNEIVKAVSSIYDQVDALRQELAILDATRAVPFHIGSYPQELKKFRAS